MAVGYQGYENPEAVARRRAMAEALAAKTLGRAPQNIGEGLNSIGQALLYRNMMGGVEGAESAGRESAAGAFSSLFGGGTNAFPEAPASPGAGADGAVALSEAVDYPTQRVASAFGDMTPFREAIAGIESGGNYQAVGPTDPKLGRALGKYQIMEANIGPWSREVLGREVTPDEFLANDKIQDAIFDGKFGSYVQQFGPEGAAQAWFAGPGGVGKTDRRDVLGTDVGSYGQRFMAALGGGGRQPGATIAPQDVERLRATAPTDGVPYSGPGQTIAPQDVERLRLPENPYASAGVTDDIFQRMQAGAPAGPPLPTPPQQGGAAAGMGSGPMAGGGMVAEAPQQRVAQALTQNFDPNNPAETPAMFGGTSDVVQSSQGPGMNQIIEALGNPWLSDNQRRIGELLLQQEMQSQDPMRQLQMENIRSQIDARGQAVPDAPTVKEFFDENGQPYKAQWNPQTQEWDPVGGSKAGSQGFTVTTPDGTTVQMGGSGAGFKKADQEFAKEYIDWVGGGFADSAKQLTQLNEALGILESGEAVTGARGLIPEIAQPFLNERGTIAREAVEEVAQRNLREILGAQFTQREGERLIARAFNPKLPPEENAKRVRRLITQISSMAQAKQAMVDYFQQNGTLVGFEGRKPSMADLDINYGDDQSNEDDPLGLR